MKVGYFGDESSYTYACAAENSADDELAGFRTVDETVAALSRGETDAAFVPIENSVGGTVGETLDALRRREVYITAHFYRRISHSLISVRGATLGGIRRIYSHPNALSQCAGFLAGLMKDATAEAVASTSAALKMVKSASEAAIARLPLEGQEVLAAEIEDDGQNTTRFLRLARTPVFRGERTAMMFDTRNEPGQLLRVLNVFAAADLNMVKLESRTSRDGGFRYWFYVEFDRPVTRGELDELMLGLKADTGFLKFAGTFGADGKTD